MPTRLIKPAWKYLKSPVTIRSGLFFLATIFFVYTIVSDWQTREASYERYRAIVQYTEESRAAIDAANVQSINFEQNLKNTGAILDYMQQMNQSMHEMADILREDRIRAQKEHELILKNSSGLTGAIIQKKTPFHGVGGNRSRATTTRNVGSLSLTRRDSVTQ